MAVRTPFAPSPTGYLHIGGARTAVSCWLRPGPRRGEQVVLRVEDADRERSTQGAIDAILEAMDWLGLSYDEGPIYQTQRLARYKEVAEQMVADGTAYYAYETKDELEAMRERAMAANEKPRYNGAYREQDAGFWLISDGRRPLETDIRYRPPLRDLPKRVNFTVGAADYVAAITFTGALLLSAPLWLMQEAGIHAADWIDAVERDAASTLAAPAALRGSDAAPVLIAAVIGL